MSDNSLDLKLNSIEKYYSGVAGAKIHVLENINFSLQNFFGEGKLFSILGTSNCGKSTLLKIIAKLINPSEGTIEISGKKDSSRFGEIIYLPENPSSFPWLSVEQNFEFAENLKINDLGNEKFSTKNLIDILGLSGYEEHRPHEKSSGFRFRIALGRALVLQPKLVLLDDPFKGLNDITRHELHKVIKEVQKSLKTSFILATTNITESIYLSEEIYLMKELPGKIFEVFTLDKQNEFVHDQLKLLEVQNEIIKAFTKSGNMPHLSFLS